MKHALIRPLVFVVILCGLVAVGFGQTSGTGAISGTITDPQGAVVQGATINAIDLTTGLTRNTVSSSNGTYVVPLLRPSTYRVEASKKGFKMSVSTDVPVYITETATVNLQLAVGAAVETVTVASTSEALKTEDSTMGQVVEEQEINSAPLVTRNYTQILGLSTGVSAEMFNAGEIGRGGVSDAVVSNGGAASDNNYQMNGVEIDDMQGGGQYSGGVATPNPDTIQEFKVQTSQYDASAGRNAGANVNVLTKTGSNTWNGNVWEFFRNEDLNANTYFRNNTGQPRGRLRQNQYGFTLGGPVKKDKLQFFTSYQGTKQQNGIASNCSSSVLLPVLTGTDRSAAALAASVGPSTAFGGYTAYTGVLVTASNVSSQALALFNLKLPNGQYLIPNPQTIITDPATGLPEGFSAFSMPCPYSENQFMTNMDWQQNSKSSFQGRFFFADSNGTYTLQSNGVAGAEIPGSPNSNTENFRNFSLTHTYLLTSLMVNQAEIGFHRTLAINNQTFPFSYSQIGSSVPTFDNAYPVLIVAGASLATGGNAQDVYYAQNSYTYQDTFSWIHGRQSLRFGGGLSRGQDNSPLFHFGGIIGFLNYPGLLLGQAPLSPYASIDEPGMFARNFRIWDGNFYAQDDIKVTKRLTLNIGFRYERLGDFGEINGRNAGIDPSQINPNPPSAGSLAGIVVSSNFPGTIPTGVVSSGNNLGIKGDGQNTINPRVGFAFRLPGTERLVLRGGYGVYHQHITGQPIIQMETSQPFGMYRSVEPNFTGTWASPFAPSPGTFPQFQPYSPSTALSPYFIDPNFRPPVYQRYGLGLQTQIAKDLVLEVGYSGMRGTHMLVDRDINEASLASATNPIRGVTTNTVSNIPLRVPYQGFSAGSMTDIQSTASAWYNSLQGSLNKRFSHGLQFLASYTFTRDLANAFSGTTGANGGTLVGDQNNPRADYGPDSFIRPQRFVFSGVYQLPGPKNHYSLAGQLLGSWKLSGVTTIQTGHLLPLLDSSVSNAYGVVTDFAEITPGCALGTSGSVSKRLNNFINQKCIAAYPIIGSDGVATGFGNSRMGILHGPGQAGTDLSLIKSFPLKWPKENANVEYRTEFFNAFNQTNFADPDVYVTDGPSFGHISTTVSNPRIIQFALKLNF